MDCIFCHQSNSISLSKHMQGCVRIQIHDIMGPTTCRITLRGARIRSARRMSLCARRGTLLAPRHALENNDLELIQSSRLPDELAVLDEHGDQYEERSSSERPESGAPSTSDLGCDSENGLKRWLVLFKRQYTIENAPMAPWGIDTILTVLILWVISFWLSAYSLVPRVLSILKGLFLVENLSYSGEAALRHLLLDVSQIVSIYILLNRSLREYRPGVAEFFKVSFASVKCWSMICLGFLAFPAVDWLHRYMVTLMSQNALYHQTSYGTKMFEGDGLWVKVLWFFVLGVVAPIWEEVMFRGFLLPSLSRTLSPAMGIFLTSILFSFVHFTKEGFLPLMILGAIFGLSYCVTRNLFPAIMLHGLWNMCLLAQVLMK